MATHHNTPVLYSGYAAGYKDLREMPMSINPDYFCLEDDFVYELDTGWTTVKDSGATVAIVADTVGGELGITSAATTDNDGGSVQGNEIFAVAADKNMFFQTRIKNNDVDQTDICVGFTVNFATNPENMLTATDRIVFQVDDGDASILCKTEKDGTETSTDSGIDMVDDTYIKLGIACSGTGKVEFFINDKLVATHSTNIPDDENLAIAAMSLSGSASGTRVTTIDYLMGARTR
jgi:hypothetical protein|tara:strand:+ start:4547 stop:5248 length:702 start_codon:yes stop_codon:yes gene_type:complete